MRPKAAICAVVGHKWAAAEETNEADLTLRCKRCGRSTSFGPETRDLPSYAQRMQPMDRFGNPLP